MTCAHVFMYLMMVIGDVAPAAHQRGTDHLTNMFSREVQEKLSRTEAESKREPRETKSYKDPWTGDPPASKSQPRRRERERERRAGEEEREKYREREGERGRETER